MAEAAVTFLLEQVKEVVAGYADLIAGAEKDFDQLKNDLNLLKAFLREMAEEQTKDSLLKVLERQIRKVVYEVEDTIDTCLTKAIEAKAKGTGRLQHFMGLKSFSLAKEVKAIRDEKVKPLFAEANNFANMQKIADGARARKEESSESKRATPIRQSRVVGFEDEEKTITGYLKEKTEKLDVISIVGIPGQGKTTLAWKIYQDENMSFHFPIRIWVNISQVFNSRDVFLQILRKFIPSQDTSSLNDNELAQTVRACLEKEKFLLVLDDVWSVEAWNDIKAVLPENNGEGKIIITTREINVGKKSKVYSDPHNLRFLTSDESWKLLQYEVFDNAEDCPPELSGIGYLIAKKCDGVPLTIVVIGGILSDQRTKSPSTSVSEWNTVSKNVSEALQDDKAQRITGAVSLSYNRLPDDLRECFVFLGVFPEDYEISAKMLCGLWISEGYILPKRGRSVEESAEENMNDLICRNLLKVEKRNHMGKVKTCRVHDMIRAFCINLSKEENLCQEIKRTKTGALEPSPAEVKESYRLCFRSDLSRFLSERPCGPHVRSFLCFYERPVDLEPEHISVIPEIFKKLRILESKCIKFDQFPAKVTKLVHLRYLTLYIKTIKILPKAITELWNLQSLVVETKSRTITMKANMWKMFQLRYLKTKASLVLDNDLKGEAGKNLHTLNRLAPESCTEVVSRKATNLKTLGISGKLVNIFKTKFLENLHCLEKLKMVNSSTYEPTSEDMLHALPPMNCFPPNLKRLTLTNTHLEWKHMSTLAMIKSLEALKLKDNAFVGVSWNLGHDSFPELLLLLIVNTDIVLWEAKPEAFPKLKFLVVKNCENLKEIPECLGTNLEKLEIERVRHSAVVSAQNIEKLQMGRPKGKHAVPFNLTIGPACETK